MAVASICHYLCRPNKILNNKIIMYKSGEEVVFILAVANEDPMNVMEVLKFL